MCFLNKGVSTNDGGGDKVRLGIGWGEDEVWGEGERGRLKSA